MKKLLLCLLALFCSVFMLTGCENDENKEEPVNVGISKESVKILAIGNSFSDNAMSYLYPILKAFGAEEVVLGNMYIGGCSVATHYNNLSKDSPAYTYRKNDSRTATAGAFINTNSYKLSTVIVEEEWDYITFQQASDFSGQVATYEDAKLNLMTEWAKNSCANPNVKIGWHMTWAYQANASHSAFPKYNKDQMYMYQCIVSSVEQKICTNPNFDFVIPAGTAVQNARTSYVGDKLTADGYHLNSLGEYIIGLTWVLQITGWDIKDFNRDLVPGQFKLYTDMIIESATNAVKAPFAVTESIYHEEPKFEVDLSKYELLEWTPRLGFWNSGVSSDFISTDAIANQFVSSANRFTKNDIPVGSLIIIEQGYGYRPDAWNTETGKSTAARPNNVTTEVFEVTEDWWNGYTYRAFNVFKSPNREDMTDKIEDTAAKLKIYVPKQ